jgi:hypothetical protein
MNRIRGNGAQNMAVGCGNGPGRVVHQNLAMLHGGHNISLIFIMQALHPHLFLAVRSLMLHDDRPIFHHSADLIDRDLDVNERVAFNSNQIRVMPSRG